MKPAVLILFFFLCLSGYSQDTAHSWQVAYFSGKAAKYLDKEKALTSHYSITAEGVRIFPSAKDKLKNSPEFFIAWDQLANFRSCVRRGFDADYFLSTKRDPSIVCLDLKDTLIKTASPAEKKKLQGLKIAIDPGHIAGDLATGNMEGKYLKFRRDTLRDLMDSIEIAEGILTHATATLLKTKLEAEGAEVFLTRKANGYTAFGKTFDDWLKEDYKKTVDTLYTLGKLSLQQKQFFLGSKASRKDKFRVIFKDLELQQRGHIVNDYHPDMTIIIHYNVDETNLGWNKPTQRNFNMAFVGGAFMKSDMGSMQKRFEFLRLLLTDDLEQSVLLSGETVKSFESGLKVKTAKTKDAKYLSEGCIQTQAPGVYCRNLQLTRYIHGPLVYGETLYQDNIHECQLLNQEQDKTKNIRVQQVAEAYFQGIINYVQNRQ